MYSQCRACQLALISYFFYFFSKTCSMSNNSWLNTQFVCIWNREWHLIMESQIYNNSSLRAWRCQITHLQVAICEPNWFRCFILKISVGITLIPRGRWLQAQPRSHTVQWLVQLILKLLYLCEEQRMRETTEKVWRRQIASTARWIWSSKAGTTSKTTWCWPSNRFITSQGLEKDLKGWEIGAT